MDRFTELAAYYLHLAELLKAERVIIANFSDAEVLLNAGLICEAEGNPSLTCLVEACLVVSLRQNQDAIYAKLEAMRPVSIRWGTQQDVNKVLAAMANRGQ